jgi:CRISPR-associated protein Cas2
MEAVYLVCYDIAHPKRLRRVHRVTKDYGARLQYSVYECRLTAMQLASFKSDLFDVIDGAKDQVLFVRLGPHASTTYERIEAIGLGFCPPTHRSYVV